MKLVKPNGTPQLALCFKTLFFVNLNDHELGNGILSYTITPPGATSQSAQQQLQWDAQRAEAFNLMPKSNTTLSDAKTLCNAKRLRAHQMG